MNLSFDSVVVWIENSLVHTKTGGQIPKNIGDMLPDFNLWYALKYCPAKEIIMVENKDLTGMGMRLNEHHVRYSFLQIWLSQVTRKPVHKLYSILGNGEVGWKSDEMLEESIRNRWNGARILMVGGERADGMLYMEKDDFVKVYNPHYLKNSSKTP